MYLKPVEVADLLRVSEQTLSNWRGRGDGPVYVKLGSGRTATIRYPEAEFQAWLERARVGAS
jgi:predicted DNA-binding transcriptional regulator AlpA